MTRLRLLASLLCARGERACVSAAGAQGAGGGDGRGQAERTVPS